MKDFKHGASGYRRRCRCEICRAGHAQDQRVRRASGIPRRSGLTAVHPTVSPVPPVADGNFEASAGRRASKLIEGLTSRQIDDMAQGLFWTSECARLEGQALTAARVIDQVILDGRVHLAPAHFRLLNDALEKLRVNLVPARQAVVQTPEEEELDALIRSIHHHDINCNRPCRRGDDWREPDPHWSGPGA